MSASALYGLSDHLEALLNTVDSCETDQQREECEAEIRRYVDAQIRKVDSFCKFLAHLESQTELAQKEIKRLKAREMVFSNLQERLEQYAIYTMQRLNLRKLEGDTSTLTLRINQSGVEIDDVELVPPQFKTIRQEIVVDKRGIKKAIDDGESVAGVHLRQPTVTLLRK